MNKHFQKIIDQLHDARIFGFLFDNDREAFKYNFYIYVQLFGDFEDASYELRKALLRFSDAKISALSIENDLSRGQFFITGINVDQDENGLAQFDFAFNSDDLKLNLFAADIEIITSEKIEHSTDQYLKTDWVSLLK
ncbi:MAG: hypothetical protein ABW168_26115 [Sedimenticola sp.]